MKTFLYFTTLFFFICCENSNSKADKILNLVNDSIIVVDSNEITKIEIKRIFPSVEFKTRQRNFDTSLYQNSFVPDTLNCSSFKNNRLCFGHLKNLKAVVKQNMKGDESTYLSINSFNIWVCKLPNLFKTGDSVFIKDCLIYSLSPNEDAIGLPCVINSLALQSSRSKYNKAFGYSFPATSPL